MLFQKKESILYSPLSGKVIPLKDVPDEVFAEEMMGPGCAIYPKENEVLSPVEGTVTLIAPTLHAIGLTGKDGLKILIHFGLETYKDNETAFHYCINVGDEVSQGQKLLDLDLDYFKEKEIEICTPIVILNHNRFRITDITLNKVSKGNVLLKYKKK